MGRVRAGLWGVAARASVATYIYVLHDAAGISQRIYVGMTADPERRLASHIREPRRRGMRSSLKTRWIRSVIDRGGTMSMVVLEAVPPGGDYQEAEQFWIAYYRFIGAEMANLTGGGEGMFGYRLPEDRRRLWSAERRARLVRPDSRTGYRGVGPLRNGLFYARIRLPGSGYHAIGSYSTSEEAATAYDVFARRFGPGVALNFPRPGEKSARPGVQPQEWDLPDVNVRPEGWRRPPPASGYSGVCWHAKHGRWLAQVKVDGKRRTVGNYATIEEAAAMVRRCEEDQEFARSWVAKDKRDKAGLHIQRSNKTGFRGVKRERHGRFVARVHHRDGDIYLGTYATPEEAAVAYDRKVRELYGADAPLNFPFPGERPGRRGVEPKEWPDLPVPVPILVSDRSPETRRKTAVGVAGLPAKGSTGFKGVTFLNKGRCRVQKFGAIIKESGKTKFLGSFLSAEAAARAYDAAARAAWGADAALNFPGPGEKSARKPK